MQVNKTNFSLFNFLLLNLTQVFPSFVILKTENNIKHADIISKLGNNERARRKQTSKPFPTRLERAEAPSPG